MKTIFDQHADYWLAKTGIPHKLNDLLIPYFDKNLTVMDLGCGGGRLSVSFLPHFSKVCAIDISNDLVEKAAKQHPEVEFLCGDFQSQNTWNNLPQFDLIVSNCVVRKDRCDLNKVVSICRQYTKNMIFRIQSVADLDFLPLSLRQELFYDRNELEKLGFCVIEDNYKQRFSTQDYVLKFLSRIGIQHTHSVPISIMRRYHIATIK